MRPDITVLIEKAGHRNAAVVEVKLTERAETLLNGFHEAMLYQFEYDRHLRGWPNAILVTSADVKGRPSPDHEVIAVGWRDWVPADVLEGLLSPLAAG